MRPADLADEDWLLLDFGPESPSLKLIGRMCAERATDRRRVQQRIRFAAASLYTSSVVFGANEPWKTTVTPAHTERAAKIAAFGRTTVSEQA